jgi:hypothetical protein
MKKSHMPELFLFCRDLSLQNSFHIITDSEEEINEKETNKNAKTHRTVSISFCVLIVNTGK